MFHKICGTSENNSDNIQPHERDRIKGNSTCKGHSNDVKFNELKENKEVQSIKIGKFIVKK